MKHLIYTISTLLLVVIVLSSFIVIDGKLTSTKTHIKFFSTTPAEDIEANNYQAVSTITPATGEVVFSVPMQGFEFDKSLMQKHFNQPKFLDTKQFPKAKLVAKITNNDQINWEKDGEYDALVEGELTIRGVSNKINEKGTISISGNEIKVNAVLNVVLADYGITFSGGKPSTNVADKVEVTVIANYIK